MSASATDIAFTKLGGHMAIAVEGLDLHRTPDNRLAQTVRQALLDNLVLCIRGQSIGPTDYLATIATFGEPLMRPEIPHVAGYPAVTKLSSDDRDIKGDGKPLIAGSHWLRSPASTASRYRKPAATPSSPTCTQHTRRSPNRNASVSTHCAWCT